MDKETLNNWIMYHEIIKLDSYGFSKRKIADYLGMNWRTVSRYLRMDPGEFEEFLSKPLPRNKILSPYTDFVLGRLKLFPATSAAQVFDWLKETYPDLPPVTERTVYNFVMFLRMEHNLPKDPAAREFFAVEVTPYGEYSQVDFGQFIMDCGNRKRKKVYFFAMVLSRSRAKYVCFLDSSFTAGEVCICHEKSFGYFGGIPKNILYDQDRTLLVDENIGELILTEEFGSYARQRKFGTVFCRKSDPQTKGKVENVIGYIKKNFLTNRKYIHAGILNEQALEWLERTGNHNVHNVTKLRPSDELVRERPYLEPYLPLEGPAGAFALSNMTLAVDYQTTIENAVLLIRDGLIEKVGKDLNIPKGYAVIDLKDKYVYPSWIDPYTQYGISENENPSSGSPYSATEQITSKTQGAFNANEAIKSETNASELFSSNDESAAKLRAGGFGAVLTFQADGLARGTSSLVSLNTDSDNKSLLMSKAATHYSFTKGSSKQTFPISKMGFIALLRQTFLNAEWYANQDPPPFKDLSLEAWNATQSLPQIFDTNGWLEILRADKLGDEFGVQYIIKGGGDEYQRINEVKSTGARLIIPINFPKPFDVEDPLDAQDVSLEDMKHWELAPTNPAILENNDLTFAFTAAGLKSTDDYLPNIRKAIEHGLSESAALKAMTHTPAAMVNAAELVGSLKENSLANFIITSNPIFEDKAIILENWVQGKRYAFKSLEHPDLSGKYDLLIGQNTYPLEIDGEPGNHNAKIRVSDTTEIAVSSKMDKATVTFAFSPPEEEGAIRLSGWLEEGILKGTGQLIDGTWVDWKATRTEDADPEKTKPKEEKDAKPLGEVIYPFLGHGNVEVPQQETLLIKNATLWTNEAEGILEETDILIENGKISGIGPDLSAPAARTIDATGKHVTSGIIDEHSHIAATSINDLATNSSMVRMNDVIDPTDINIYTALSGGVTAVQILHGSANPIGGQSAIIKLRWGRNPEEMKIKEASPFIKFALGENVKRSGNTNSVRYPQTRMGVEQVYVDAFTNAADYLEKQEAYNRLSPKAKANEIAPRRDLAMEAIGEILRGERSVSCHSYVQSEINMLLKVAEKFNFRVNTFTHILEGYKVADIMKAHGAGASTFSDWYAYKWEVRYAIPYNAAIMHQAGLTVAINSDDAEMGRRLNQEAAKAIKYGGVSQEEAWKMVTLNPAKLLHLDQTMGSLKVGKDGDVVIWTDNPLSVYAKVENTILDGTIYYDVHKDAEMNQWILAEKARLIQKMKSIKKEGGPTQQPKGQTRHYFHCDDLTVDTHTLNF